MISAVIQDNEESVGPLADGEVARLFSALQNAEFTRSDKHDFAKNSSFRQRSLIEIANDAKQRKDVSETERQNSISDVEPHSSEDKVFSGAKSDSVREKNLGAEKTNASAPEQTIRDIKSDQKIDDLVPELEAGVRGLTTNSTSISENVEPEQGLRELTSNPSSVSETGEAEQGLRGLTSVQHGDTDGPEKTEGVRGLTSSSSGLDENSAKNSFETANAAFERGKAEGISEGRLAAIAETKEMAETDAKAELADIVDRFHKALDSLMRPKAMQAEALSGSINKAILKLASDRAGMQIDEIPEAFSDKVNALVASIGQELSEGKIHLNEDDYDTMKPFLMDLGFEIVVEPSLMRGDVTIQFDGIELHDHAANRLISHPAERSNDAATDKVAVDDSTAVDDSIFVDDGAAADDNASPTNLLTDDGLPPQPDEPG